MEIWKPAVNSDNLDMSSKFGNGGFKTEQRWIMVGVGGYICIYVYMYTYVCITRIPCVYIHIATYIYIHIPFIHTYIYIYIERERESERERERSCVFHSGFRVGTQNHNPSGDRSGFRAINDPQ